MARNVIRISHGLIFEAFAKCNMPSLACACTCFVFSKEPAVSVAALPCLESPLCFESFTFLLAVFTNTNSCS